jgi:outer membrane murein-binding lipoprotein Lpp
MFDRLATLVIELKQQVSQLENRVSALEAAQP